MVQVGDMIVGDTEREKYAGSVITGPCNGYGMNTAVKVSNGLTGRGYWTRNIKVMLAAPQP